jgi:diguanylate cyclase (GGDEF)-like protein
MNVQYLLYLYPMLLTCLLSAGISIYAWQRREVFGALTFSIFMADVALWSLTTGLLGLNTSYQTALIWYKLRYLSISTLPAIVLICSIQFTRQKNDLPLRYFILPFILPIITLCVIWFHFDFFATNVTFRQDGPILLIKSSQTQPWFIVHLVYSQLCSISAVILLLINAYRTTSFYRKQSLTLVIGALPPIIVSAFLATFFDETMAHFTPISFFIMGLFFTWAMFRYRLLDLVPISHSLLINYMTDGLLVFDNQQRVIEINPAAEKLLDVTAAQIIGKYHYQISDRYGHLISRFQDMPDGQVKIEIGAVETLRHLDVRLTPILDRLNRPAGRLVIFHDISDLFFAMQRLEMQIYEIEALQDELKEQTIRDPLTGLYNRRYLEETLTREFARAQRESYPISLVMIDIDHFKQVNDTYGHGAGDLVLQELSNLLLLDTRQVDIVCRMGGEEILIVLPNASKKFAFERAEIWRTGFQDIRVRFSGQEIQATISIGVAAYPEDGDNAQKVVAAADMAMYSAKAHGRNRVELKTESTASQPERLGSRILNEPGPWN